MKICFGTIIVLVSCFTGCSSLTTNDKLRTLDLEAAIDKPRAFDLAEIAYGIEFTRLDNSTTDALVGEIKKISGSHDKFYIMENSLNTPVKVFDSAGKFLSTRGTIGRGPSEYLYLKDITIDPSKDNIYVLTRDNSMIAYDASGRMFARNDSVDGGQLSYYMDQLILMKRGSSDESFLPNAVVKIPLLDLFSLDLSFEGSVEVPDKGNSNAIIGSFDTNIYITLVNQFVSDGGNPLLIKEGRSDTVFYFKGSLLNPAYKLEMGDYSIPSEMFENVTSPEEWEKYYSVEQMYESNRYIICEVMNGLFRIRSFLVFDKSDPLSGFTTMSPDGQSGMFIDGIEFTPCYIRDNRLVGYMQALDIVDNAEAITNPDLRALAATLREDSNPVIVVAKLKK